MTDAPTPPDRILPVEPGTIVYDEDGDRLGVISGFTDDGFEVTPAAATEGSGAAPTGDEHPGHSFGEGYLMWRCDDCGEMGELEDGLPATCPNCGAPRTALYRVKED